MEVPPTAGEMAGLRAPVAATVMTRPTLPKRDSAVELWRVSQDSCRLDPHDDRLGIDNFDAEGERVSSSDFENRPVCLCWRF